MTPLGVGFVLHPDADYLRLCHAIIEEDTDFLEVSPETLWQAEDDRPGPGPWAEIMATIRQRSGKPFVGHGLGLSPGTATDDEARLTHWLQQIAREQDRFEFLWYTEHLGWIQAEGREAVLPLPLPPTEEAAQTVAARLARLKPIIPTVGFENQVSYFFFGDVRQEARFWNRISTAGDLWLLLDLHNAWTQCVNHRVPLEEYLAGLDLSRVLEIHLAGGSDSDPGWLPDGRTLRLDSHDGPIPAPVWQAFAAIRPHCPNLRGVVVERMDGTFGPEQVPALRSEVQQARRIFWEG